MANQNTLADILQSLSDEQLQGQMKSPGGDVPQYLVLSELQRRQKMRAEANDPPPPPTTTVADDLMQSGVAATPEMSMGGADVPASGVASFAGGGEVNRWASSYPGGGGPTEEGRRQWREALEREKRAVKNGLSRVKSAFGGISDYAGDRWEDLKGGVKNIAELGSTPLDQLEFKGPKNDLGQMRLGPLQGLADQGAAINDRLSGLRGPVKAAVDFIHPPAMGADGIGLPTEWQAPAAPANTAVENPLAITPADVGSEGSGGGYGRASMGGGVMSLAGAPRAAMSAAEMEKLGMPKLPDPVDYPTPPKMSGLDEHLARLQRDYPDVYADMIAKNQAQRDAMGDGKKDAFNMALLQTGLGMMTSRNSSLLGALGEGGLGGLKSYAEQMRDHKKELAESDRRAETLTIAKQQAALGNLKTAADLQRSANNEAKDAFDMDYKLTRERNAERKGDAQWERQLWTDMYKQDQQNAREDRRLNVSLQRSAMTQAGRSGGRGGKAPDALKTEAAAFNAVAARTKEYLAQVKEPPLASPTDKAKRLQDARAYAMQNIPAAYRKIVEQGGGAMPAAQAAPRQKINFADIK